MIFNLRFLIGEEMDEKKLKDRTKQFALNIMKLVDKLPNSIAGRTLGNQLVRSGTSVGANYRAACRGRSKAEFTSKIGIVAEEADESAYWLELIMDGKLLGRDLIEPLLKEANELAAIFIASAKTAGQSQIKNHQSKIKNA